MKNCHLSKKLHRVTPPVTPLKNPEIRINTGFLRASYTVTPVTPKNPQYIYRKIKFFNFNKKIFSLIGSYKKWCNGVTAA